MVWERLYAGTRGPSPHGYVPGVSLTKAEPCHHVGAGSPRGRESMRLLWTQRDLAPLPGDQISGQMHDRSVRMPRICQIG